MTLLITTGFRNRVRNEAGAVLPDGKTFRTQDELHAYWRKQLEAVPESSYVSGSGPYGIFTQPMADQAEQITPLDSVWGVCNGLGVVHFTGRFPPYDLGDYEGDLRKAVKGTRAFSPKRWWNFITEITGQSFAQVIRQGIAARRKVLLAIPFAVYLPATDDILSLLDDKDLTLDDIRAYLRVLGPRLEEKLHPKLLDCLMPYDLEALDRVVPGAQVNGGRRAAFLLARLSSDEQTDPIEDYELMQRYCDDPKSAVLDYRTGTVSRRPRSRLSDAELREIIEMQYWRRCHGSPVRIARIMRDEGYPIRLERVREALGMAESAEGEARGKAPVTAEAKPAGKRKTGVARGAARKVPAARAGHRRVTA